MIFESFKAWHVFAALLFFTFSQAFGQSVPLHAEGLTEELISTNLDNSRKQQGVLSIKTGTHDQSKLAVLLPGYPSVVRPIVENGVMQSSKLTGNFLIRARRHLADDSIATLVVDCQSDSGDYCSSAYQASKETLNNSVCLRTWRDFLIKRRKPVDFASDWAAFQWFFCQFPFSGRTLGVGVQQPSARHEEIG